MSLSTFCDLVWLEIWDDCSPMGDQHEYREIVHKLFIEGIPPWEIFYDGYDAKGKKVKKRLGERPTSTSTMSKTEQVVSARDLFEKLGRKSKIDPKAFVEQVQAAKQAAEVASPPSG